MPSACLRPDLVHLALYTWFFIFTCFFIAKINRLELKGLKITSQQRGEVFGETNAE